MTGVRHRDLYAVLGVARDADSDAIRDAYRELARRYHPDLNPDDATAEERMKEISEAYSILSNAEKRSAYDEFGDLSLQGGFDPDEARRARDSFRSDWATGRSFSGAGGESFSFGDLGDLLGDLFGGGQAGPTGPPRPRRGADLEAQLSLGFREAALGCEKPLSVTRPDAHGGLTEDRVTVRIPPGVEPGSRIRLSGKGAESRHGGPPGDLYARVSVQPDPVFRSEGHNLLLDLPVAVREALLGAEVEIPTLTGRASLRIPAGSSSGARLRLRGKGIPRRKGGGAGDLIVTLQIQLPPDGEGDWDEEALRRLDPPDLRSKLFA